MRVRLYHKNNSQLIEKNYPPDFSETEGDIYEVENRFNEAFGYAVYKEIYFKDVHIGYGNIRLPQVSHFHFDSDFETIEMHFTLKGKSAITCGGFNKNIHFDTNQHNIVYSHRVRGQLQLESLDFQLVEINLTPHFFKRFIPDHTLLFDTFRNALEKQDSTILSPNNHHINHQMYQTLNEIMQCQRKGIFKRMFMEAKVIELLLLQFEQYENNMEQSISLKRSEIDKIYAVKEFIEQNLDENYSLIDLARQVGTNEYNLKKGFKELFGTTVFGYWNDTKMEQAKRLLTTREMNINEVSDLVGYKNPRHFSTAFKKKFGFSPSQLKD